MAPMQVPVYDEMKKRDADLYARLENAGFMLDFGVDGSGLFMKYLRRGSGYYIDVGASELVANGSIKLKSRVDVERISPHSLVLSDGTELPADLIVYATGYGSLNGWLADLILPRLPTRSERSAAWAATRPRTPARGKANCTTCGSPRRCRICSSTAATCTIAGTTRSSWPCSSRRAGRGWRQRFTRSLFLTTSAEPPGTGAAQPWSMASTRASAGPDCSSGVYKIDLEHCLNCDGLLKIIAAILESAAIERILTHLGLQARAPPRAPAPGPMQHAVRYLPSPINQPIGSGRRSQRNSCGAQSRWHRGHGRFGGRPL